MASISLRGRVLSIFADGDELRYLFREANNTDREKNTELAFNEEVFTEKSSKCGKNVEVAAYSSGLGYLFTSWESDSERDLAKAGVLNDGVGRVKAVKLRI